MILEVCESCHYKIYCYCKLILAQNLTKMTCFQAMFALKNDQTKLWSTLHLKRSSNEFFCPSRLNTLEFKHLEVLQHLFIVCIGIRKKWNNINSIFIFDALFFKARPVGILLPGLRVFPFHLLGRVWTCTFFL